MRAAEEIAKALGKSYDLAAYNSAFHLKVMRTYLEALAISSAALMARRWKALL